MNGKNVIINSLGEDLNIPLNRIIRVSLAKPEAKAEVNRPWEVRALAGGAAVSFNLNQEQRYRPGRKRPGVIRLKYIQSAIQSRFVTENQRHERRWSEPTLAMG